MAARLGEIKEKKSSEGAAIINKFFDFISPSVGAKYEFTFNISKLVYCNGQLPFAETFDLV